MTEKSTTNLVIASNRRLQEATQKLYMAKQELEKQNRALQLAEKKEKHRNAELKRELADLKHLARPTMADKADASRRKKLTGSIAEDLSLRYIHLLESYSKTKDLHLEEPLVDELCRALIEYGITPKGLIGIHLKSVPQIETIGDLETKRVTFESRMVLLRAMTHYATLLQETSERGKER